MNASEPRRPPSFGMIALAVAVAALIVWYLVSRPDDDALIVYCAHDLVFAEPILKEFEQETGIPVVIVPDTEATKSLGLVERILQEQAAPQCDVFWNNQTLGTIQLQEAGVLHPYQGTGYQRIPAPLKDPDGHWVGFGGRLRVWIVNTDLMEPTQAAIDEALAGEDLQMMAIAMPVFGTTLSHYSLLWEVLGEDGLKQFHSDLENRGCRIVSGNSTVKNLVAEGVCTFGMTDTDDFFVGKDAGAPVEQIPIRVNGKTICIPNSVAIIKGTRRLKSAQALVDYLASQKTELKLAASDSRQIPLGPVDESELPEDVKPLARWARETADLKGLGSARADCLRWLKAEYAP